MKKKKTRTKPNFEPKVTVHYDDVKYPLCKNPEQKRYLNPLTAEEQAKYLESLSEKEQDYPCYPEIIKIGKKQRKQSRKLMEKSSHKGHKRACRTLCSAPDMLPDPKPGWLLLLLCMLASVLDLILPCIPRVPGIALGNTSVIPAPIRVILRAFHGPTKIEERGIKLKRPCYLNAHVSLGEALPSARIEDYLGGCIKIKYSKRKRFWIPLRCTVFSIAPNVPKSVRDTAVGRSPLAIPILCTKFPPSERLIFQLDGQAFQTYDPRMLKKLKKESKLIFAEISEFTHWMRQKKGRWKVCKKHMKQFQPRLQEGRFVSANAKEEAMVMAAALPVFKQFLRYASKRKWISHKEARSLLREAWVQVLPESAAQGKSGETASTAVAYNDPAVFYQFLGDWFLPTYKNQIQRSGKGEAETMALLHQISDVEYVITPREDFADLYARRLEEKGAAAPWRAEANPGAALQRALQEGGVPLRGETNNPATWRYKFYKDKEKKAVDCFAIPTSELPEGVRQYLEALFGTAPAGSAGPSASEAASNSDEGGKSTANQGL